MGTAKRERKKQNREMGRQAAAASERRRATIRRSTRIVAVVVVLIALFFLIAVLTNDDDTSTSSTNTENFGATTTLVGGATTTIPRGPTTTLPSGPVEFVYGSGECAPSDGSASPTREFDDAPQLCIDPAKTYTAVVETNEGSFTIELDLTRAPGTVNNFVNLARYKYFDDTECHRAIPNFVVQCGDPTATGTGGPGYSFADELPESGDYQIGSIAMANSGPNTNGSQFFVITGSDGASLPPNYTLFGQVTDGLDVVAVLDSLGNPNDNGVPPLGEIRIVSVTVTEA
ncbi:MAG: peptidylprolyl isomerase [Ilumatobacteraceae bacterium]